MDWANLSCLAVSRIGCIALVFIRLPEDFLVPTLADIPSFPRRIAAPYRLVHAMDEKTWRQGEDHHREVRWPHRDGGEQRVPEDGGLPRRVEQRVSRHAGFGGAGDGEVGAGGVFDPQSGLAETSGLHV